MSKGFNIQETVHRNIERNQFPSFANHRSLVGWCTMNYPKVLLNPTYLSKPPEQSPLELHTIFQEKNPIERAKQEFVKPFSHSQTNKVSSLTLATTNHETKARIFAQNNIKAEEYSAIRPLSNILGGNRDGNFERKVRQIGEVYYNPPNEGEVMRHLKKLPNTIIDEQNLLQIMDNHLEYLDLQYKADISNDLINKIGYLAPNIKELVLIAVPITNEVLIELGISCKFMECIDISLCKSIDESAMIRFIRSRKETLRKFSANHNTHSFTDACLEALSLCPNVKSLSINFCSQVTSVGMELIGHFHFETLHLSSLPNLKAEDFSRLLMSSQDSLVELNMGFNAGKDINNNLMMKVGLCSKLESLTITGCESISDQGMNNLIYGEKSKVKNPEGFAALHTLKIGGLSSVSDQVYQLCKRCPMLAFLELNNLERLTDHFIDQIKSHASLRTLLINFTPNISEEKIKEVRETVKQLNIIRNITKMTDPTDDGLRMPIPPASLKIKKPKKKKK